MRWITARRRRPLFGYAAVLLALVAVGMLYAAVTGLGGGSSYRGCANKNKDQKKSGGRGKS